LLNICGQEDAHEMEVDSVTSVTQAPAKYPLPELEIYCYLLVLIFLIDQKKYNEVKQHIITERLYILLSFFFQ
jgi:26S proteasome regulatory subunit N3